MQILQLHLKRVQRFVLLIATCIAVPCVASSNQPKPPCLAFVHATVVNPSEDVVHVDRTVVICGTRIRSIEGSNNKHLAKPVRVVDAQGKFLIPGLWDMHVHLTQAGESSAPLFLVYGVTSVRDCGSTFAELQHWRSKIDTGTLPGPRIKGAGALFESESWLEKNRQLDKAAIAKGFPPDLAEAERRTMEGRIGIKRPDEAQSQVDSLKAKGADFIKVRNAESPQILYALAEAARRDGLPVAGHVIAGADLARASDAGQKSIEHDEDYFDSKPAPVTPEQQATLGARFARNGTVLVPTIVVQKYRLASANEIQAVLDDARSITSPLRRTLSPELLTFWRLVQSDSQDDTPHNWSKKLQQGKDFVRAMRTAGVEILPGTDLGTPLLYPGESLFEELQVFVNEIGMSPREALQSATMLPARWFRMQNEIGSITPGKLADLVLVDANPLRDIRNLRKISGVVANGRFYDRKDLDRLLVGAATSAARN
jgi:imidazolonepropionase-like amidohydrolase